MAGAKQDVLDIEVEAEPVATPKKPRPQAAGKQAVAKVEAMPPPATPAAQINVGLIERILSDPNQTPERINQAIDFYQRIRAIEARAAFDAAMASAKAKIPPILKSTSVDFDTKSGSTNFKHETLAAIATIVDPILAEFGLSYRFRTNNSDPSKPITVTCIIAHRDGYSEENPLAAPPDATGGKNTIQAIGSTVTYLQRYTLKAALGIAAGPDDNGKASSPKSDTITEAQAETLFTLMAETKANLEQFCIAASIAQPDPDDGIQGIKAALSTMKAKTFPRMHKLLIDKRAKQQKQGDAK